MTSHHAVVIEPHQLDHVADVGLAVDIASHNPFLEGGADPKILHVAFLVDRPSKPKIAALDPDRSPPDRFVVRRREIYLRLPNGVARSKLTTQYFDSRLATTSTVRNWSTVLKVLELAGAQPVRDGPAE